MKITLPHDVEFILDRLCAMGHTAYVVGGPVRDFYLGETPSDYDITTSATPVEIKSCFADCRTVDTGIKHGTVTLVLSGESYEITTYRIDGEYKDSRHPEQVYFTDRIEEDLARRDFTVHAMAYSPRHGLCDPFGGRADLAERIIRTVGSANDRFMEDALRILRALRFASKLDFSLEEGTRVAIFSLWGRLSDVSRERIWEELKKLFGGRSAYAVLSEYGELIAGLLGLSKIRLPEKQAFDRLCAECRMIAVFALSAVDPAEEYFTAMKSLHTDTLTRERGRDILLALGKQDTESDVGMLRALSALGEEKLRMLISLETALTGTETSAGVRLDSILSSGAAYRISDLKVNGRDMLSLGLRGPAVGDALSSLLDAVISGRVENERTALIGFVSAGAYKNRN